MVLGNLVKGNQIKLCKLLAVNTFLMLFTLILLESIFGGWFKDASSSIAHLNVVQDTTINYDLNGIYASANPIAQYKRDKYGLRGQYKDLSSIDILTVGGSATDQRFITEGFTWQDQMAAIWLSRGDSIHVVNAGVDGQSTYGHLKNFKWWFPHLPNFSPKYILFYIGVNDLFGNVGTIWDAIEDKSVALQTAPAEEVEQLEAIQSRLPELTWWQSYWDIFEEKSALLHLYRLIMGNIRARLVTLNHSRGFLRGPDNWTRDQKLQDHSSLIAEDLNEYKKRVKSLIFETKKIGAKPIIVTQTAHYFLKNRDKLLGFNDAGFFFKSWEVLGVDIYYFLKAYSDAAIEICQSDAKCIGINLFEELELDIGDFYDNVHNTPIGAKKIAQFLVDKLENNVEFDRIPRELSQITNPLSE